ncbi:MAG: ABC transporter substrate-binding protein [Deltaproteobacteria bacterium]|nr:MAG: ABC transporter substrate-binding protein [Deltaproteobacteria bacterium]
MKQVIAVVAAVLLSSCIDTVQAQTMTLRYGQIPSTIKSVSALHFNIAQRKGLFIREGINIEMISIEGGAANMMMALDRGAVDITRTASFFLIQAALKGSEGVAVAGETATPIYSLIVKPEIKTFADLKGKVVGLTNAVSTISVSMRKLLALNGLGNSDYRVIEFVGTPERSECLRKGECDAVPLGQPEDFTLLKQGYRRLGISNDAVPNFQFIVSAVRRSWGEANKDALVRYIRGLAAAFRFMRDPANREDVVKIILDTTGSSDEIARQTLALYFEPDRGVFPKQGELDIKGLGQVIQFMGETGDLKPPLPSAERFVDLQYLRAVGIQ